MAGFRFIYNLSYTIAVSQVEVEQEKQEVISLVKNFGNTLKSVSLTAPDNIVAESIKEHYSDYVTPELLAMWQSNPQSAPGRTLSSPWPDRIDVINIEADGNGGYIVSGEIIEVTGTALQNGGTAARYQVTLGVIKQDIRWCISSIEVIK